MSSDWLELNFEWIIVKSDVIHWYLLFWWDITESHLMVSATDSKSNRMLGSICYALGEKCYSDQSDGKNYGKRFLKILNVFDH